MSKIKNYKILKNKLRILKSIQKEYLDRAKGNLKRHNKMDHINFYLKINKSIS